MLSLNIDDIRHRIDWIFDLSNKNIIIHSDIDGVLSMAFLQQYAGLKQIVGLYDLDTFYFIDKEYTKVSKFKDLIAIDLDISYYGIRNLGHHMTCVKSADNSLNINEYAGIAENLVSNYTQKYPLNTIILLYSIFGIEPSSDEEIALLIYADSVYQNFNQYNNNVVNWLTALKQHKILDALNNRYEKLMSIIRDKIVPITSKIKDTRYCAKDKFSQCQLTSSYYFNKQKRRKYNGNPKELIDLIRDITNWNVIDLPKNMFCKKTYFNKKVILGEKSDLSTVRNNLLKLEKYIEENPNTIVSSSMAYINGYKITSTVDVNII